MSKKRRRVLRGGSYYGVTWDLRTTGRIRNEPEFRLWYYGFRIVVSRRKQ
jgi:formylglycine-generating enzyme required for sulfatase activity